MKLDWFSVPDDCRTSWELEWPPRLCQEIAALNRYGQVVNVERLTDPVGCIRVSYYWRQKTINYPLCIIYLPGFPYVRPQIYLLCQPSDRPRRHCDPSDGRLCYLGHQKHSWRPLDLIANVIEAQLPGILAGNADEDAIGEPAETWWAKGSPGNSMFVIESAWHPGGHSSGTISAKCMFVAGRPPGARILAQTVYASDKSEIATRSDCDPVEFRDAKAITIPWIRFDEELFPRDPAATHRMVRERAGDLLRTYRLETGQRVGLIATVFPTEIEHGVDGSAWVLFMFSGVERAFKPGQGERLTAVSLRTLRAGDDDRLRRAPSAESLHKQRIVIAGTGALGAPIALELARNGIGYLGLVDNDFVSPGNSVRWPFGESAWGKHKLDALREEFARSRADLEVETFECHVGEIDLEASSGPGHTLNQRLTSSSVIVDATANFDALQVLVRHAGRIDKPVVSVNATPTLAGGAVALFVPRAACPICLINHQEDGTVPKPPGESNDALTLALPGCAEATFAGASFDLGELSLEAVRVVVRQLREPPGRSFVETLSFVGPERLPSWQIHPFDRHPACRCG